MIVFDKTVQDELIPLSERSGLPAIDFAMASFTGHYKGFYISCSNNGSYTVRGRLSHDTLTVSNNNYTSNPKPELMKEAFTSAINIVEKLLTFGVVGEK